MQSLVQANPVTFAPQSARLSDADTQTLGQIAGLLKTTGATVTVSTHAGYADPEQARQLSEQRADSIVKALRGAGVDSAKIKSQASGSTAAEGDQALRAQISTP